MMEVFAIIIGVVGALAGAASAYFWLAAAKVPPAYPRAVLSGPTNEDADNIDLMAKLNANGARCAALAVGCQAILLVLQTLPLI